jgi:hypothetical protein
MAEPDTEELRLRQAVNAERERTRADEALDAPAERRHARRAAKADYLKQKLDERAESEERVQDEP